MRSSIPEEVRLAVLRRDKRRCRRCGARAGVVHHVVPVSEGGRDAADNLVVLCMKCHKEVHVERGDWYAAGMSEDRWCVGRTKPGELALSRDAMEQVADMRLGQRTTRVLMHLLGRLEDGNWVTVLQRDVGRVLGLDQPAVSAAFRELVERQIMSRVGRAYRMSPVLCWKGSWEEYWQLLTPRA